MTEPENGRFPVTVVIPVRNEISSIGPLLTEVFSQRPAAVVVVDAGSTDGTRQALRTMQEAYAELRVIEVDKAYPGEGRNLGSAAAETPWVVYIDGGTHPHAGWLAALWEAVAGTEHAVAYGYYVSEIKSLVARWFTLAVLPPARAVPGGLMRNHFIACSIVRKAAWETIGGFPATRAAEDRIFMLKLVTMSVVEAPDAVITWIGPQSWGSLWRRQVMLAEHSARAGRERDWHWPTLRYWLLGAMVLLLLPVWVSMPMVVAGWLLRTERRLQRHRLEADLRDRHRGDRLGAGAVLLVTDLAMYVGWARRWLCRDLAPIAVAPSPRTVP